MTIQSKRSLLLFAMTAITLGASCKKQESSDTSALTNQTLACTDYSAAQYQQLSNDVNSVPGLFSNFPSSEIPALLKHFNAIPPSYRAELLSLKKNGVFTGFVKADLGTGGVMGSCSSNNRGPRVINLTSRYPNAISFAMIHEIGHGVEGIVQRRAGKSNQAWEANLKDLMGEADAYNKTSGVSRVNLVRDYAFASDAEFFAETFHNYYCSPATHSFIQKNLPKTYAFLKSVLEQPVWAAGTSPAPNPAPSPAPSPNDDKGEALALQHVSDIVKTYNGKSTRCNLKINSIKNVEADGDFVFDAVMLKLDDGMLPAVRLRTNYKLSIANEMADLKAIVPKLFAGCPAE